jgi:glycosyltransferase involved in cell wall biosynthesis
MKNNSPLVSVGITTYNNPEGLRRTLMCITKQTYKNLEIIVSNDCSPNRETETIVREFIKKDARIRYFSQNVNKGALVNYRFVLMKATGKYFMWADDDDYWLPEFVDTLVKELEFYPEAGLAMSAIDRFCEDGTLFDHIRFNDGDDPNNKSHYQMMEKLLSLSKRYNLFICGLFRTHILKKAVRSFYEVLYVDYLFMCPITLATRFRYVDRVLYKRLVHIPNPKGIIIKKNSISSINMKALFTLAKGICTSDIIPWHRKLYLPLILAQYLFIFLIKSIKQIV